MDNQERPWQEIVDEMYQTFNYYVETEVYQQLKVLHPKIEISLAFEDGEFEHERYYNTPDEAIEALKAIKDIYYE